MAEEISPSVRAFIHSSISSVEQLEVLLYLRANAGTEWTIVSLATHFRSSASSIEQRIQDLLRQKLISCENESYRYAPSDTSVDSVVAELQTLYVERRISIIELIFNRRRNTLRNFADSFRIKEGEDPDHG